MASPVMSVIDVSIVATSVKGILVKATCHANNIVVLRTHKYKEKFVILQSIGII